MSSPSPIPKPILKHPPGYKHPNAPPPPPNQKLPVVLPPSFYHTKTPSHRRTKCCRLCCCTLCLLFLLLAALLALSYLIISPKAPAFRLLNINLTQSNYTETTTHPNPIYLISNSSLLISAQNPNHNLKFYCDEIYVTITLDGEFYSGEMSVPGFEMGLKSVRLVRVEVKGGIVGERVEKRVKSGAARVGVEGKMRLSVGVWRWRFGRVAVGVRVSCGGDDVSLKEINNGGEGVECRVGVLDLYV